MCNDYLSKKLLKKYPTPTKTVNVYSEKVFAEFYNETTDKNAFHNDLDFFKRELNKTDLVIEFASGTGRILEPLLDGGFNIIGIEEEKSMIDIMRKQTQKHVINNNIFKFKANRNIYKEANCFIIPATSISLFSLKDIENLFSYLAEINNNFSIIFDIIDINSLIVDPPKKVVNKNGVFYYTNFQKNEFIVYNLYHVNSNSYGYSVKYNHKREDLYAILNSIGYKITVNNITPDYFMVKAEYKNV